MIYGIGIDLIEIERVQRLNDKQPKLIERILSPGEQQRYHSFQANVENLNFSWTFHNKGSI